MRVYSASNEEALRAGKLLADWAGEGLLTQPQYQRLKLETVSELRTTNIFLRLILFLFTLICVGAAGGLLFSVFLVGASHETIGVFLLIYAAVCYVAAETVVSQARLYRYGIEEALAVCSVVFLCVGILLCSDSFYPLIRFLVAAVGTVFSLWIWHRFGLWYAFLAAMVFAHSLPDYWTSSAAARDAIVALLYAIGLVCTTRLRSRSYPDYIEEEYSLAEAFL